MLQIIVLVAVGFAVALAVHRFGADSRDGLDWRQQQGDCSPYCG